VRLHSVAWGTLPVAGSGTQVKGAAEERQSLPLLHEFFESSEADERSVDGED